MCIRDRTYTDTRFETLSDSNIPDALTVAKLWCAENDTDPEASSEIMAIREIISLFKKFFENLLLLQKGLFGFVDYALLILPSIYKGMGAVSYTHLDVYKRQGLQYTLTIVSS